MHPGEKISKALCLLLFVGLICPFNLRAKLIKPANTQVRNKIENKLVQFRKSVWGKLCDSMLLKTGLYLALDSPQQPCIIPGKTANFTGNEIKVVTANLILFPKPLLWDQNERIRDFSKAISPYSPDIIFIQEVWDNNSLIELARNFPDYWISFTPSNLYHSSGLLTLSRFEIEAADFFQYPLSLQHNFEELLARKGFLITKLRIGQRSLTAINTHLYSAKSREYRPNPWQFELLQTYVLKQKDIFCLMGGDMNIEPDEIQELMSAEIMKGTCNKPTAGGSRLIKKLDYLFIKPGNQNRAKLETIRVESELEFSDHRPVFGKIAF